MKQKQILMTMLAVTFLFAISGVFAEDLNDTVYNMQIQIADMQTQIGTMQTTIDTLTATINNLPACVNGKSAFEIWLDLGNSGTESDFIASLKGADGLNGLDGQNGADGLNGVDGKDGYTPIKGVDYFDGINGLNGIDGVNGLNGVDGLNGLDGQNGADGKSAYQIWLDLGNSGTESDFIASLKGEQGIQGIQGEQGIQGIAGQDGTSADTARLDKIYNLFYPERENCTAKPTESICIKYGTYSYSKKVSYARSTCKLINFNYAIGNSFTCVFNKCSPSSCPVGQCTMNPTITQTYCSKGCNASTGLCNA